jgi:hypothetical protein
MERLRARRRAQDGVADLPAQDESEQWDRLLGEGAKKKTRCGICTRPIGEEQAAVKALLCSSCELASVVTNVSSKRGIACNGSKKRSCTPSTNADTDDLESASGMLTRESREVLERKPDVYATLKSCLEGKWLGDRGETYHIVAQRDGEWLCVFQEGGYPQEIPLLYDERCGTIWWCRRGNYFLDVSDISSSTDTITWSQFRDTWGPKKTFTWHLPIPHHTINSTASCKESELMERATHKQETKLGKTNHSTDVEAKLISDILEQLSAPGKNGFVWVESWNERYRSLFGTLRSFLEGHPDIFTVIPLKGKAFRVARAKRVK